MNFQRGYHHILIAFLWLIFSGCSGDGAADKKITTPSEKPAAANPTVGLSAGGARDRLIVADHRQDGEVETFPASSLNENESLKSEEPPMAANYSEPEIDLENVPVVTSDPAAQPGVSISTTRTGVMIDPGTDDSAPGLDERTDETGVAAAGGSEGSPDAINNPQPPAITADWEAALLVKSGVVKNSLSFGEKPNATTGFDGRYDVPAMLSGDLQAAFLLANGKQLWRDIRANDEVIQGWELRVIAATGNDDIVISWQPTSLPKDKKFQLLDLASGDVIDMHSHWQYVFANSQSQNDFVIECR